MPRALTTVIAGLFLSGVGFAQPTVLNSPNAPDLEPAPERGAFSIEQLRERLLVLEREARRLLAWGAEPLGDEPTDRLARAEEQLETDLGFLELELHRVGSLAARELLAKVEALRYLWREAAAGGDLVPVLVGKSLKAAAEPLSPTPVLTASDDCDATAVIRFGSRAGTTRGASNDGEASCGGSLESPDIWYRFVAPAEGRAFFDTVGSDFDTVLSVHSGCPGVVANELACSDDVVGLQSALSLEVDEGVEYWIRVAGFNSASGRFVLNAGAGAEISGQVTDARLGVALESVRMTAFDSKGEAEVSAFTDPSGNYAIGPLAAGIYTVQARHSDRAAEFFDDVRCSLFLPPFCRPELGTPVQIDGDADVTGVDFSLERFGEIRGRVTDSETGDPLAVVPVTTSNDPSFSGVTTVTDESGHYAFSTLIAGTYSLLAWHSEYESELYRELPCVGDLRDCAVDGTPVQIYFGEVANGIDFTLDRLGEIEGRVTAVATGEGLPFVTVTVFESQQGVRSGSTDADGAYRIGGLDAGVYHVAVEAREIQATVYDGVPCPETDLDGCDLSTGTAVVVGERETVKGVDFSVDLLGSIDGRVIAEVTGEAIDHFRIDVFSDTGRPGRANPPFSNGRYEAENLAPGTYFVRIQVGRYSSSDRFVNELFDDQPCQDECDVTLGTPVVVKYNSRTTGVDFVLDRFGRISGKVSAAGSGEPIAGISVGASEVGGALGRATTSDENGAYIIEELTVGEFIVRTDSYELFQNEIYDDVPCLYDDCESVGAVPVSAALNTVASGIDFSLERLGVIEGRVVDETTGEPLAGVDVILATPEGSVLDGEVTDADGFYRVSSLRPGFYLVSTRVSSSDPHVDEMFDDIRCLLECRPAVGTPVEVALNTTTEVDFALDLGGTFAGRVVSVVSGDPIAGIVVVAEALDSRYPGRAITDINGVYRIEGLIGTYRVFTDSEEIVNEAFDGITCSRSCDTELGTPIVAIIGTEMNGIDFLVNRRGTIEGSVATASGVPAGHAGLYFWRGDERVAYTATDELGFYSSPALDAGTYFVSTETPHLINEVFDDIPCGSGVDRGGCISEDGEGIAVMLDSVVSGIDFVLGERGSIAGSVLGRVNGEPLSTGSINVYDENGRSLASESVSAGGFYRIENVLPGSYFVLASASSSSGFVGELFQGIPCLDECSVTKGTPVAVMSGRTTTDVDFHLIERFGGITGRVSAAVSKDALAGVPVEIWNLAGERVARVLTGAGGTYVARLSGGTYFVSTATRSGFTNEIYDDIECVPGACDPTSGLPVVVIEDVLTERIDFVLGD